MARPSVPDTSALIREFHHPQFWFAFERSLSGGSTWLSSVVIAELYAGTRSRRESFLIGRLVAFMERAERLLVPTADEWILVGRLLNRRTRLHGAVRPRDHLADLLILVSAARLGGEVVTANLRQFEPWARLAEAAGLNVAVRPLADE